ncbi:related to Glutaredoxin [Ustilago trichophora]|uniref:Related to Glutaredoxin n=1 Tax=Ustilago trichophora TaxID=86804 RepID=A0A5C3EGI1_9BASI|nr:related to Glutaredoxin [Ustilago trichophora]
MGAESKEHLLHDLESGVSISSRSSSSCTPSICLPPLALLRRKKVLVFLFLIPTIYLMLIYNGSTTSLFESQAGSRMLDALHHASPAINELAGKLPVVGHHYDDAHLDKQGHLHNALLDNLHIQGTPELTALKHKIEHDPSSSTALKSLDLALQVNEMSKFNSKDESVMLLLLALQTKGYAVDDDWKGVYVDRTPLQGGIFASLNAGPTNKFTQLLAQVGFPQSKPGTATSATGSDTTITTTTTVSSSKFSILDDAHQLYALSRQDWVTRVRPTLGLTVFSKSYCPYSKKAKALLNSLNATYTLYEVDLRPDAHNLQSLLSSLTGHRTFPTILVRDRLLGGNDDLQDLESIHALKSVLESVGAM